MSIEKHFELILDKYDLRCLYNKFIIISIVNTTIREGFYWSLLFLSDILQKNPEMMQMFSGILIFIYGLNIPFEKYFLKIKTEFIKEIRLANYKYFNDKVIHIQKKAILDFDLIEYFNALDHFNDNLQEFVMNQQIKFDIPIRCVTLVIIAVSKKFYLLVILFAIFYCIIVFMNEKKLVTEQDLTKKLIDLETQSRNYMINSKHFIMNDEFNENHFLGLIKEAETTNKRIFTLNDELSINTRMIMYVFIIIVILAKKEELNYMDFFYYFLIVYDIEFISDKVNEYHKNKVNYNKMRERLNYLNTITVEKVVEHINGDNTDIKITTIRNTKPHISNETPIIIRKGDHILLQGESGSGKTSLLYTLKGMLKPEELVMTPSIDDIKNQSYLSLSSQKCIYSGNLYDIISNYEDNPDSNLIEESIKLARMEDKLNKNENINVDKLSGGERIRLIIARLIYALKKQPQYNILLFDEIDDNLNDVLAMEVANNLLSIFNDKTILYVTHNEKVKKLFTKKIFVKKGALTQN